MSDSFYMTLPSHSSKNEFPDNTSNHFRIWLSNPIRLEGSGWKVGLCAISLPDPENGLPQWLTEAQALLYNSWFHGWKSNMSSRKFLSATFKVSNVHNILDLNNMTGVDFMQTAIEWLNKQRVEKNMIPGYATGYTTST